MPIVATMMSTKMMAGHGLDLGRVSILRTRVIQIVKALLLFGKDACPNLKPRQAFIGEAMSVIQRNLRAKAEQQPPQ